MRIIIGRVCTLKMEKRIQYASMVLIRQTDYVNTSVIVTITQKTNVRRFSNNSLKKWLKWDSLNLRALRQVNQLPKQLERRMSWKIIQLAVSINHLNQQVPVQLPSKCPIESNPWLQMVVLTKEVMGPSYHLNWPNKPPLTASARWRNFNQISFRSH